MEKMQKVGWMENVKVQLKLKSRGQLLQTPTDINDMRKTNLEVDITLADTVCLEMTRASIQTKEICEVSWVGFGQNLLTLCYRDVSLIALLILGLQVCAESMD